MGKLLLPIVLLVAGAGGGVGAGMFLGGGAADGGDEHGTADDPQGEDHGKPGADASAPNDHDAHSSSGTEFARLSNQFIVPVVKGSDVVSLVVLTLTLEVEPGGTEKVFSMEPRIRDSFLRVLFDHANVGGFDAGFTKSGTMTLLRRNLLEAAGMSMGEVVRDILIVDIVRQEV